MAAFPFRLLRWRNPRATTLPIYEQIPTPSPTEERFTKTDSFSSGEDEDEDLDTEFSGSSSTASTASTSSRHGSRQSSGSYTSASRMLPRRLAFRAIPRRPTQSPFYRLPNKVVRYLCLGMIAAMMFFIFGLIRASQIENQKIAAGAVPKPRPAPPAWEAYPFLTRYYGGVRSIVPFADHDPEYPRSGDELPYNSSAETVEPRSGSTAHQVSKNEKQAGDQIPGSLPETKAFSTDYPHSVLASKRDQINECFLDAEKTVRIPLIRYFDGRPRGFPEHIMGSYELVSLPEDICFDRYGRYGPYGFGYSSRSGGLGIGEHGDNEGAQAVWQTSRQVDFRPVNWADTQRRCYRANAERFKPIEMKAPPPRGFYISEKADEDKAKRRSEQAPPPSSDDGTTAASSERSNSSSSRPTQFSSHPEEGKRKEENQKLGRHSRTAVVIRCWDEYLFGPEDKMNLRSLITELALASGSRYDVHLLVQVRNDVAHPIWADDEAYRVRIEATVPEEFRGLVTLWTQTQMLSLYHGIPDLFTRGPDHPVHGAYRGLQMAMQYFAYNHPEYDYFWQWEMDIRYTGHYYDLFSRMEDWATQQPRKGLWERNSRFYVPSVHGTWDDFKQMARVQTEMDTASPDKMWEGISGKKGGPGGGGQGKAASRTKARAEQSVWGPVRPTDEGDWFEEENDPEPPTSYDRDKHKWGVGEEADLITLNPIFDPQGTTWLLAGDIAGYNETDGKGKPPRRAAIIAASRMSRRLLLTMHRETAIKKHHAFPEMWPATTALHHGYKAVFVPHPLFVDRQWPTEVMARTFNGGKNGASGGARTSVFGQREHNLRGLSWFYNSGFAPNLYRRWLGLEVNNDGGGRFETESDGAKDGSSVGQMKGGEGRMCLPPMLIHPVKDITLPDDQNLDEAFDVTEVQGSDPAT